MTDNPTGPVDLDEFEAELQGWLSAYPLSAFPEPDLAFAAGRLKAGGMTLDSISASNMRHVVSKIVPQALALLAELKVAREALTDARDTMARLRGDLAEEDAEAHAQRIAVLDLHLRAAGAHHDR